MIICGFGVEVEQSRSDQKVACLVPALPANKSLGKTLKPILLVVFWLKPRSQLCLHQCVNGTSDCNNFRCILEYLPFNLVIFTLISL